MKSIYIRIVSILPMVIALTIFAVGNQMTVLGQTIDSSGIMPPSNDSFENASPITDYTGYLQGTRPAVFIPGNTTFFYLRSRSGHDRTVTLTPSFIDGHRVVPGDYFGDSRSDICLWKYRTGDFECFIDAGEGDYRAFHFGLQGDEPVASSNVH